MATPGVSTQEDAERIALEFINPPKKGDQQALAERIAQEFISHSKSNQQALAERIALEFIPPEELAPQEIGLFGQVKRKTGALVAGAAGTVSGFGGGLEALGLGSLLGGTKIREVGESIVAATAPEDPTFSDEVAAGLGSMATFLIPGTAGGKVVSLLQAAPKFASWAGIGIAAGIESFVEGGSSYNRQKSKGLGENESSKSFWVATLTNLPLNVLTTKFGGLFDSKGRSLRKILSTAFQEGGQEAVQEAIQSIATDEPIVFDEMMRAAAVGAVVGGGVRAITGGGITDVLKPGKVSAPSEVEAAKSNIVSTETIERRLSEMLDIPIRYGRFNKKNALGISKIKPEVIRLRFAKDIETVGREVGHLLDKRLFGGIGKAGKGFMNELGPIATKGKPATEGFAEFVSLYVTNQSEAIRVAPKFYTHFDNTLDTLYPDIKQALLLARKNYSIYTKSDASAMVAQHIQQEPAGLWSGLAAEPTIEGKLEKVQTFIEKKVDQLYTHTFDKYHPIHIAKETISPGLKLAPSKDPELLARLFAGSPAKAEWMLKNGVQNFDTGKVVSPGLSTILEPLNGRTVELDAFAASIRVVEDFTKRYTEDEILKKTGLPLKVWEETRKDYDNKVFRTAFQGLRQFENAVLDYYFDATGTSPEERARIRRMNDNHVPFYRVMTEPETVGADGRTIGRRSTFVSIPNPIKGFEGSARSIISPIKSIIKNTLSFVNMADKYRVVKAIADLADIPGAGAVIELVPAKNRPIKLRADEIKAIIKKFDPDVAETMDFEDSELAATIFRPMTFMNKPNHIAIRIENSTQIYRVSPELYKTLENLDYVSTSALIKMMAVPARTLRTTATGTFTFLGKNIIRDAWEAAIFKLGIHTPYYMTRGLFHVLRSDAYYDAWVRGGGAHATVVSLTPEQISKSAKRLLEDKSISHTIIRHPWELFRSMIQASEEITRLAVFHKKMDEMLGQRKITEATKDEILEGVGLTRDTPIDFSRVGSSTQGMRMISAFWNANMQGLDKTRRFAKAEPFTFAMRGFAGITLPSLYLVLSQWDDYRWKLVPQWQKDSAWVILTGPKITEKMYLSLNAKQREDLYKSTIWRVPKPFHVGVMFGSVPERITEWLLGVNPDIKKSLLETVEFGLLSGLLPIPTAMLPIIENHANWSQFLERPIVPKSIEYLEKGYQTLPHTRLASKYLGEAIGYPPVKLENLIRGWTAGWGLMGMDALDMIMQQTGIVDLPPVRPERTLSDIPVISGFVVRFPSANVQSIETFYRLYEESRVAVKTHKFLLKDKENKQKSTDYYNANETKIRNSKIFRDVANGFSGHRETIRGIYKRTDMDPKQKRIAIDRTYIMMIELAGRTLKNLYRLSPSPSPRQEVAP